MPVEVLMPQLGWSMEEGVLHSWLVEDGATVAEGEPLYVVETDKTETEIGSPASGVVRLRGTPGEVYAVGACVAEIE